MAKYFTDAVLDGGLTKFATGSRLSICSADPVNFAGIAAVSLGNVVLTPGNGNGTFTIADSPTSGRRATVAQQVITPSSSGTMDHYVIDDGTAILGVTNIPATAVTSGVAVTLLANYFNSADPV